MDACTDLFAWTPPPLPAVTSDGVQFDRLELPETWAHKFDAFDAANSHVYGLFKRYSMEAIAAGVPRLSSIDILCRVRWHTNVETRNSAFKINANFTAYFARKFVSEHPQYAEMFEMRRLRSAD